MTVILYSQPGCGVCRSARDKLERMGVPHDERDLSAALALHEGWRGDGSVELTAASALLDGAVPMISVDGQTYDYPGAMRALKATRNPRIST